MNSVFDFGPLRFGAWVQVLQEVCDLNGRVCAVGTRGLVGRLDLNLLSMVVHLDIQPTGAPRIELKISQAWFAARRERLHEYFALVASPPPPSAVAAPPSPALAPLRPVRTPPPSLHARELSLEVHFGYILELARSGQTAYADAHWDALLAAQPLARPDDRDGERRIAEMLAERALRLRERNGHIPDMAAWQWLCEMSLSHWHAWGAQATSGGEGSGRAWHIRASKRMLDEAEQAHRRAPAGE